MGFDILILPQAREPLLNWKAQYSMVDLLIKIGCFGKEKKYTFSWRSS
jgi:hypothetical protein